MESLEATWLYQRLRLRMNKNLVKFFVRYVLKENANLKVAEVACGSGFASHLLAQAGQVDLSLAADLTLFDFRQAGTSDFRAVFILMDIYKPAIHPELFDLVWNSSSIEELENPKAAIRAMAWMVKPGGYVFVGVPNRYGPAGLLGLLLSDRYRQWLGRNYSRREIRALLLSCSLVVERELTYFFGTFIGVLARKPG